jgi:cytochrome c556
MRRPLAALVAAATLAVAGTATADTPADAIKYRQNVMKAMSAHFAGFFSVNMGRISQPAHLKGHVDGLAALGAMTKDLFPAGSDTGAPTDALPLIWSDADGFAKAVKAMEDSSAALKKAVDAGDKAAAGAATKALGEACKGCHDRYRKEQPK